MENENQTVSEEIIELKPKKPKRNILRAILFSILEAILIAVAILSMAGGFNDYCISDAIPYESTITFDHDMTIEGTTYPAGTEFTTRYVTMYGGVYFNDPATGKASLAHFGSDGVNKTEEMEKVIEEYKTSKRKEASTKSTVVFVLTIIVAAGIFFAINFKLRTRWQLLILGVVAIHCFFFGTLFSGFARAKAPVVYLYPEEDTEVNVRLLIDGNLSASYPFYDEELGWNVTAKPDGTLTDTTGREYSYLFWEGDLKIDPDLSQGFCVKGEDTVPFLEKSLKDLGLNDKEAAAFISFWLPYMKDSNYNVISFQTTSYEDAASMDVSPAPDTVIRVNMLWFPSDSFVEMEEQDLTLMNPSERDGFTVVEWGGEKYERGILTTLFR